MLTISIPTWNRERLIKDLLEDLIRQINKHGLTDLVQILVSNNASDDNTHEIVEKLRKESSLITYNKNSTNIGGKSNVLKSMEMAETEYVLFIGDDDLLNVENLKPVVELLKSESAFGVYIDSSKSKFRYQEKLKSIDLEELMKHFYWYIGNAGNFIVKTSYIKDNLSKYGYDFFNECWPQTQLMILGLQNSNDRCCVGEWGLRAESVHNQVMIYTSFYLWRTCYYDLFLSIHDLKNEVSPKVFNAARVYLKGSLPQQLLNILQCGIFLDEPEIKQKTVRHIFKNMYLFSFYEKLFFWTIIVALSLPAFIAKPLSEVFIFCLKGSRGINKKNDFVDQEKFKKAKFQSDRKAIRALSFEKE